MIDDCSCRLTEDQLLHDGNSAEKDGYQQVDIRDALIDIMMPFVEI